VIHFRPRTVIIAIQLAGRLRRRQVINHLNFMNQNPSHFGYITQSAQGIFAFPAYDKAIGGALLDTGTWATEEIEMISKLISPEDEVLIVGGHLGTVAVPISRSAKRVAVVEANPEIYKFLQANMLLNGVQNADLVWTAAGNEVKTVKFLAGTENSGGSKISPVNPHPHYLENLLKVCEVQTSRLDDQFRGRIFRIIFMDIEGSEYFALQGMPTLLSSASVLFVEFIPHHLRYVAAVSPQSFASLLSAHFNYLYIPSMKSYVEKDAFEPLLSRLYDLESSHDQIVFTKDLVDIQKLAG
jgi:FkbM family methyltransferase